MLPGIITLKRSILQASNYQSREKNKRLNKNQVFKLMIMDTDDTSSSSRGHEFDAQEILKIS
jgi:hypothetical protein